MKLNKEVKDLYNENFKSLKKKIEEGTRRQKDLSCSWIARINNVKMTILPKAVYRCHSSQEKKNLKFLWRHKSHQVAKGFFSRKNKAGSTLQISRCITESYGGKK